MELYPILGIACVAYTAAELMRLSRRPSARQGGARHFEFGAVDVDSGRPIEVWLDRRIRNSPAPGKRRRGTDRL